MQLHGGLFSVKKSVADFADRSRQTISVIFCRGVYVAKYTSRGATCRNCVPQAHNEAPKRSVSPFVKEPAGFFDKFKTAVLLHGVLFLQKLTDIVFPVPTKSNHVIGDNSMNGVIFLYETRQKRAIRRPLAFLLALLLCGALVVSARAESGERTLIPLGKAVGIKLFADGALVVSVNDSPAKDSGISVGDLLLKVNGTKIESTEQLQEYLQQNGSAPVTVTYQRSGKTCCCTVTPRKGDDGVWRMGAWIRDSMAGIGTLTYYDPLTGTYGALGHGITDVDTQVLMTLDRGSIMETTVKAVKKGCKGDPGELKGDFSVQRDVGTLTANTVGGVFGRVSDETLIGSADALSLAKPQLGKATILATVGGCETRSYNVEILRLYDGQSTRNLLLRITDPRLLEATGGIVQGMSGSPILQNGKLVGAVTHVLLNDPTQGYGIYIENMLNMAG